MVAHPIEIVRQLRQTAGKMGVGNLGQAKFGHATGLPGYSAGIRTVDAKNVNQAHLSSAATESARRTVR
jgi:hypothetical protein